MYGEKKTGGRVDCLSLNPGVWSAAERPARGEEKWSGVKRIVFQKSREEHFQQEVMNTAILQRDQYERPWALLLSIHC